MSAGVERPESMRGAPPDRRRRRVREAARRLTVALVGAICFVAITACAGPTPDAPVAPPAARTHAVHVVSHGWHTGLVLDRASLEASGLLPEAAHFPDARLLEFGWGDRDFYMTPDETLWMTLKAGLAPTAAVMHVVALERPPEPSASTRVIRLAMSEASLRRLIGAVSASFDRPEGGEAVPIERGLRGDSWFYPATGRFHVFDNCNTWAARMLSAADDRISPAGVVTAEMLMRRVQHAERRRAADLSPQVARPSRWP